MTAETRDRFLMDADELPESEYREAEIERDGQPLWLVLTRHQGTPRAWLNVCPHQGRAMNWAPGRFLTDGEGRLVCAAHGAVFDPADGRCIGGPCRGSELRAVEVAERDGAILLVS